MVELYQLVGVSLFWGMAFAVYWFLIRPYVRLRQMGRRTVGKVLLLEERAGKTVYHHVRYEIHGGVLVKANVRDGLLGGDETEIDVVYDPDKPSRSLPLVMLDDNTAFIAYWGMVAIAVVGGFMVLFD